MPLLFTENTTNNERLFPEYPNDSPYVKDGINNYVVQGNKLMLFVKMSVVLALAIFAYIFAGGKKKAS